MTALIGEGNFPLFFALLSLPFVGSLLAQYVGVPSPLSLGLFCSGAVGFRELRASSVCTCTLGRLESVRLPFELLPKLYKFELASSVFLHPSSVICICCHLRGLS